MLLKVAKSFSSYRERFELIPVGTNKI